MLARVISGCPGGVFEKVLEKREGENSATGAWLDAPLSAMLRLGRSECTSAGTWSSGQTSLCRAGPVGE